MRTPKDVPDGIAYRERIVGNPSPALVGALARTYGLGTENISPDWRLSEAETFAWYMLDLDLSVFDCVGKDILDIGCGQGAFKKGLMRMFPPRRFVNLDAVVRNAETLDICADANRLPFPDESFDLVIARGSISHTEPHALAEAARVTRRGGTCKIGSITLHRCCWKLYTKGDPKQFSVRTREAFYELATSLRLRFLGIGVHVFRNIHPESGSWDEWLELRRA